MLYYMVNTTFFWTLGVHNIVQDTLSDTKNKPAFFSPAALKKIFLRHWPASLSVSF